MKKKRSPMLALWIVLGVIALIFAILSITWLIVKIDPPEIPESEKAVIEKTVHWNADSSFGYADNSWIRKRSKGHYEMYIEGSPYSRGVLAGKLSEELIREQEEVFLKQIQSFIPSKTYIHFLRILIGIFNRNLDKHIPVEYLQEIYGISQSASPDYKIFGPAYMRLLNYHAAHDIGHGLQKYMLVGCTSFSAWGGYTADSQLISGRNFDFYFGDEFSANKIIEFVKPDSGYPFAYVSWGGMTGVVSGMNMEGLSVTINAGTASMPSKTATPVSIIAREILQYASNIEEAQKIANSRNSFVSETFLITSAKDNMAMLIEKTSKKSAACYADSNLLACTNHFQSEDLKTSEDNEENIQGNATSYRYKRLEELISDNKPLNPIKVAEILRNRNGLDNKNIGMGNEKAINQLIAHHSIIFLPHEKKFWICSQTGINGEYIAYDLEKIFNDYPGLQENTDVAETSLIIPKDPYYDSPYYAQFILFQQGVIDINRAAKKKLKLPDDRIKAFKSLNPDYWESWKTLGDYYLALKNYPEAIRLYEKALSLEVNSMDNEEAIKKNLSKAREKYNKK